MTTKEKLLNASKELFSLKGYANTTVDDIVRHAGLSKGAFYFYFKSKDQLIEEMVNSMAERTKDIMRGWLQKDVSAQEAIKGHVKEFLSECYEDRQIAFVFFFELLCSKEEFRLMHRKHMDDIRQLLTLMVEKGYRKGEFRWGSVETLVNLIVGYARLIYIEKLLMQDAPLEEILLQVEEGFEIIFRGLKCG